MFNMLLDVVNISDTTSGDNIPGGVASGFDFDTAAFVLGIFVGVIITFTLIGIVKYIKFIIKDNKEMKEKLNFKESE